MNGPTHRRPHRPRGTRCAANHPGVPSRWMPRTETRTRFFRRDGEWRKVTYSSVYCGTCEAIREQQRPTKAARQRGGRRPSLMPVSPTPQRIGDHSACDPDGQLCAECRVVWDAAITATEVYA